MVRWLKNGILKESFYLLRSFYLVITIEPFFSEFR